MKIAGSDRVRSTNSTKHHIPASLNARRNTQPPHFPIYQPTPSTPFMTLSLRRDSARRIHAAARAPVYLVTIDVVASSIPTPSILMGMANNLAFVASDNCWVSDKYLATNSAKQGVHTYKLTAIAIAAAPSEARRSEAIRMYTSYAGSIGARGTSPSVKQMLSLSPSARGERVTAEHVAHHVVLNLLSGVVGATKLVEVHVDIRGR